jgi:hypothetical protein
MPIIPVRFPEDMKLQAFVQAIEQGTLSPAFTHPQETPPMKVCVCCLYSVVSQLRFDSPIRMPEVECIHEACTKAECVIEEIGRNYPVPSLFALECIDVVLDTPVSTNSRPVVQRICLMAQALVSHRPGTFLRILDTLNRWNKLLVQTASIPSNDVPYLYSPGDVGSSYSSARYTFQSFGTDYAHYPNIETSFNLRKELQNGVWVNHRLQANLAALLGIS